MSFHDEYIAALGGRDPAQLTDAELERALQASVVDPKTGLVIWDERDWFWTSPDKASAPAALATA